MCWPDKETAWGSTVASEVVAVTAAQFLQPTCASMGS